MSDVLLNMALQFLAGKSKIRRNGFARWQVQLATWVALQIPITVQDFSTDVLLNYQGDTNTLLLVGNLPVTSSERALQILSTVQLVKGTCQ